MICLSGLLIMGCSKDSGRSESLASGGTGQGGSLSRFTIAGDYLYAVDNSTLYAYDISIPANPILSSSKNISAEVETLYSYNGNLFIGTTTGMFIYSLSDPANPLNVGEARHARACDPVVAKGNFAYVTLKGSSFCGEAESGLYVHNINDITNPSLVRTIPMATPEGLGVHGDVLYVCCNNDGLKVMDISAPANPTLVRTVTGAYFKDVIPFNDILICYVSTGILLYDITNPDDPQMITLIAN